MNTIYEYYYYIYMSSEIFLTPYTTEIPSTIDKLCHCRGKGDYMTRHVSMYTPIYIRYY